MRLNWKAQTLVYDLVAICCVPELSPCTWTEWWCQVCVSPTLFDLPPHAGLAQGLLAQFLLSWGIVYRCIGAE